MEEKQYISTHVVGSKIADFRVRKGQVQIVMEENGHESSLFIGARGGSVTLCFQGDGVCIEE